MRTQRRTTYIQRLAKQFLAGLDALTRFGGSTWARRLVLGLFVAQAVFLVFAVAPGTPPDELNHIDFIQYYANHSLSPVFSHQMPTYNLGDKTREVDYLYHYTMSLVYRVLPLTPAAKYYVIRLFSVAIGLSALLVFAKIARRLGIPEAATSVGLLILTNLPMVLMMSAAINNDAPVWLAAALSMLLLLRLWERPTWLDLLVLAELVIIGGLIKRTLLPFEFAFGVLGLVVFIRHYKLFMVWPKRLNWRIALLSAAILVSSGLAIERIGGNLVRYHTITPSCEQVQGAKPCAVFWLNSRTQFLSTLPQQPLLPLPTFTSYWIATSVYDIVDVQAQTWKHEVIPASWLTPLLSTLLVAGLLFGAYADVRAWGAKQAKPFARYRLYVLLFGLYVVLVHLVYNYLDYRQTRSFGVGLNGRYILPGILPLGLLAAYYWSRLLDRWPRLAAGLAMVAVLATIGGSGLIMMVRNPQLFHG